MELSHDICYRALRTRDRRYDGRFFTGVTSTGIYCRPVCPARTPRRDHCTFFPCAAAAEAAGFRPCRRCRPETAPGTPAWQGTSATVSRALRLIGGGALDGGNVDDLAARLGVGGRHLRRLFQDQLGASPLAIAMTRRVHLARRMLVETSLSVEAIALATGFASARRLRAAFTGAFAQPPSAARRGAPMAAGALTLHLAYRPPLPWDVLLAYLRPRAIPGVEVVTATTYRRSVAIGDSVGVLEVTHDPAHYRLVLRVPPALAAHVGTVVARVRDLYDLDADPEFIGAHLDRDPQLAGAVSGVRVPGTWDPFELAVRAILGQQITVAAATRLAGRLVAAFGTSLAGASGDEPMWVFPTPAALGGATRDAIARLGMPGARAVALRDFAAAVAAGEPLLAPAASLDEAVNRITERPGLGPWTANYVALRGLREPDAFPAGDLHLRRALATGSKPLTERALLARAEAWRPWRGYAAFRLWTRTAREET